MRTVGSESGRRRLHAAGLALTAVFAGTCAPRPEASRDVLVVVVDDWGVDMHAAWGLPDQPRPPTPAIDALIDTGVRFENAWAMPVCSPTRATMLTGRYPWRHGLGWVVRGDERLEPDEVTLPELLDRAAAEGSCPQRATAAFGKWHLGQSPRHPLRSGFDHFEGSVGNLRPPETYCRWEKNSNGTIELCERYATSETVDDALAWIADQSGPWLAWVAFHAAHSPWHVPPAELAPDYYAAELPPPVAGCPPLETRPADCSPVCDPSPAAEAGRGDRYAFEAMIQALDTELGRLLAGVDLERTTVILIGDNGTPPNVVLPPLATDGNLPAKAKASVFRGGVAVPLVVAGAGVAGAPRSSEALVSVADVFTTAAALCGLPPADVPRLAGRELDALDFSGVLRTEAGGRRARLFAEQFDRTHPTSEGSYHVQRTLSDGRFKLLRLSDLARPGQHEFTELLFDLRSDPWETLDLSESPDPEHVEARERLRGELERIPLLPTD